MPQYHGEPEEGFYKVSHWITSHKVFKNLKPTPQILYWTLCRLRNYYADDSGIFYRSDSKLSEDTGMSTKSVCRARDELWKRKFIRCQEYTAVNAHNYHIIEDGLEEQLNDYPK